MRISFAEMPSLVILVWAEAGRWVSASAPTARPSALNDFDIAVSSSLARVERRMGAFSPSPFSSLPHFLVGHDLDPRAGLHFSGSCPLLLLRAQSPRRPPDRDTWHRSRRRNACSRSC